MGRRNMLDHRMAYVHPRNRTPSVAVVIVGMSTAFAVFLGQAGLVPILEVGAVAAAIGWMAACASYFRMKPALAGRAAALFGVLVTVLMVLVKIVPIVPGHFTKYEWMAVGIWAVIGAAMRMSVSRREQISPEIEPTELPTADSGL
jgi:amino acid transporter